MKTLLLGIDGLDPALADEFHLPNIERIGDAHEIDTYGNSGPSWATVMTGLRPAEHGVRKLNPQLDVQTWQGTPIWEKIDGYSGVANVPATYPPSAVDIDGWLVSGMMTPSDAIYTTPRNLYKELDDVGYRIDVWVENHENHEHGHYGTIPFDFSQEYRDELLAELEEVIVARGNGFAHLLENEPVDFAFLCFTSLDRVQHLAMDDRDTVREFYQMVDAQVGRILSRLGDDVQIVATSDHGFQEIDMPTTDITGEHRKLGWAATNIGGAEPADLHDIHDLAVASANRSDVTARLEDLGYLE